jgi:hypothetical protein
MADRKWDHVLACEDYNVEGNGCPLLTMFGTQCAFFGDDRPRPESGVCDKNPDMLTPRNAKVALVVRDVVAADNDKLTLRYEYRMWKESFDHYAKPLSERLRLEFDALLHLTERYSNGPLSRRLFKKHFKPNNIGLAPGDEPSFRMRVLHGHRAYPQTTRPERAAVVPQHIVEKWVDDDGTECVDERWVLEIMTHGTLLQYEIEQGGLEQFEKTDLPEILSKYEGQKILVEWSWSTWRSYEGDYDFDIDYLKFLRVL